MLTKRNVWNIIITERMIEMKEMLAKIRETAALEISAINIDSEEAKTFEPKIIFPDTETNKLK